VILFIVYTPAGNWLFAPPRSAPKSGGWRSSAQH